MKINKIHTNLNPDEFILCFTDLILTAEIDTRSTFALLKNHDMSKQRENVFKN